MKITTFGFSQLLCSSLLAVFIFIINAYVVDGDDLFLLRRTLKNNSLELLCVYNGPQESSTGLSWLLPPSTKAEYEMNLRWKHKHNTAFVRGHFEYYGHIWLSRNSMEVAVPNMMPPVFDERWNEFPVTHTDGTGNFQPLSILGTDKFHLSVLARSDAQVALHNNESPQSSHTYLFTFDAKGVPGVTLELCNGGVAEMGERKCQLLAKSTTVEHPVLKNGKEWAHFTFKIEQSHITHHLVVADAAKDGKMLLDYRKHITYNKTPSFISVRTINETGTWRLHKYRLVAHNGRDDGEGFNVMSVSKTTFSCLQIYYFFRAGFGRAFVRSKSKNQTIELEPTYGKWKFATVRMEIEPPHDHFHFIPPYGPSLHYVGTVFAMHQPFRVCGENEFFTSKIIIPPGQNAENATCKSLITGQYATLRSTIDTKRQQYDCPKGSFSKFCNITCGAVVGDHSCQSKVMCDQDSCTCLPGYIPTPDWDSTCTNETSDDKNYQVTPEPVVPVEDEDEEENLQDDSDDYFYTVSETNDSERTGLSMWWIVTIVFSWILAIASIFLVIKERPDLMPMCILGPVMRCTGQSHRSNQQQLINEDA